MSTARISRTVAKLERRLSRCSIAPAAGWSCRRWATSRTRRSARPGSRSPHGVRRAQRSPAVIHSSMSEMISRPGR
ncbi:hypothetical protein [Streptomyces sp. NBC_00316]|uniref:hypothetical protein n=1 Tax=Streptomyces sp. NBC_00316 TaxID=2975710 RepID=UPI002E2B059F|nr:hypothetical protein [Streptomyces sp. NBC_00316]